MRDWGWKGEDLFVGLGGRSPSTRLDVWSIQPFLLEASVAREEGKSQGLGEGVPHRRIDRRMLTRHLCSRVKRDGE